MPWFEAPSRQVEAVGCSFCLNDSDIYCSDSSVDCMLSTWFVCRLNGSLSVFVGTSNNLVNIYLGELTLALTLSCRLLLLVFTALAQAAPVKSSCSRLLGTGPRSTLTVHLVHNTMAPCHHIVAKPG